MDVEVHRLATLYIAAPIVLGVCCLRLETESYRWTDSALSNTVQCTVKCGADAAWRCNHAAVVAMTAALHTVKCCVQMLLGAAIIAGGTILAAGWWWNRRKRLLRGKV